MTLGPYQPNEIYEGECSAMMEKLPDGCVDLTVTSPPYDNLRDYNGFTFDYTAVISQLYRVTKPGGTVVWVVGDATINGSETGTSFRQALYAMECGFNLHDTMFYHRWQAFPDPSRYAQNIEYMFVWSKGKPKTINLIRDRKNKNSGKLKYSTERQKDGSLTPAKRNGKLGEYTYAEMGYRENIWGYKAGYANKSLAHEHPASFPESLARDHILSWSNPGDIVLDPMVGSGTVPKMAYQNGRQYLGFDISGEYVTLAKKRVSWANPPLLVIG